MQSWTASGNRRELCGLPLNHTTTRYEPVEEISREADGSSIWVAFDHVNEERVTLKRIPRGPNVNKYVEREVLNRRTLFHPHITRMREVVVTDASLDIVIDFAPGRDLAYYADHFAPLSERHARHFFQQIVLAVDFCHKRKTCVRDIRLDNLALNMELDIVKLQNFNLSKHLGEQSKARSLVGKLDYIAPEILMANGVSSYDGYAVDVWATGICLFTLLYGFPPFSSATDTQATCADNTRARILAGKIEIPDHHFDRTYQKRAISMGCIDLLSRLLESDPKKRITITEILRHPWFLERLPPGALDMNEAVDPVDEKLYSANKSLQRKSLLKRILAYGAQPVRKSFLHHG